MLSKSNTNIIDCLTIFKDHNILVTFIVPTDTGLQKSIMDATRSVRSYLKSSNLHDFDNQRKGEENKKIIAAKYIYDNQVIKTKISFYRPITKQGDPRLWIYGLKKYAHSGDLLALSILNNQPIIINCTKINLKKEFSDKTSILFGLLSDPIQSNASELLDKLKDISKLGFIKSLKKGDTGIGYTLESLLQIEANSSPLPDYKGIELKSRRTRSTKNTLFSAVPDWKNSKVKSAAELVDLRGVKNHDKGDIKTIFHTIKSINANTYGLKLEVDDNFVHQIFQDGVVNQKDVCWELSTLMEKLNNKHKETFWIDAETRINEGSEEFHYKSVLHTSTPDLDIFPTLIESGIISVDYLLWEKRSDWKEYIKKKGYDFLWKISNKNKNLLFRYINEYSLS